MLALPLGCFAHPFPGLAAQAAPVLLSVSGLLRAGPVVHFDMAALAALPQHSLTTTTPWYSQPRQFTGPLLRDVLQAAGALPTVTRLRLTALNDYRIEIPAGEVQRHDVILARRLDGQPMAVRDKGPLLVMYPFEVHAELRTAVHYSRAIWQVRSLELQ
jgi:hypothetical protein